MNGDIHIDEAEREIGYQLPRGDYETVAGMLIAHSGNLPAAGETVIINLPADPADLVFDKIINRYMEAKVAEVERHVPTLVYLTLREIKDDDDATSEKNQERSDNND